MLWGSQQDATTRHAVTAHALHAQRSRRSLAAWPTPCRPPPPPQKKTKLLLPPHALQDQFRALGEQVQQTKLELMRAQVGSGAGVGGVLPRAGGRRHLAQLRGAAAAASSHLPPPCMPCHVMGARAFGAGPEGIHVPQ